MSRTYRTRRLGRAALRRTQPKQIERRARGRKVPITGPLRPGYLALLPENARTLEHLIRRDDRGTGFRHHRRNRRTARQELENQRQPELPPDEPTGESDPPPDLIGESSTLIAGKTRQYSANYEDFIY